MSDANTNLEQYLNTYFIRRNNTDYVPIRNVGYTSETLTYMPSAAVADRVTGKIVGYMKALNNNVPFDVYDATAGTGGSSMSFLDNPNIHHVYTYEIVPERMAMQRVNFEGYGFKGKYTQMGEFKGVPKNAIGSVAYFDPPWLPEGVSGLNFNKSQYIQENTIYAGHTLEEWVALSPQCAMVVFRVPPGYKLKPVPGWTISVVDDVNPRKKNQLLYLCVNDARPRSPWAVELKQAELKPDAISAATNGKRSESIFNITMTEGPNKGVGGSFRLYNGEEKVLNVPGGGTRGRERGRGRGRGGVQLSGRERYETAVAQRRERSPEFKTSASLPPPQLLQSFQPLRPVEAEVDNSNVVVPDLKTVVTVSDEKTTKDWTDKLKNYLMVALQPIADGIVAQLIDGSNWEIWKLAFTERTYDPVNNYEILEILGDSILEAAFTNYLYGRLSDKLATGEIAEKGVSNLRLEYLSKPRLAAISNTMRLPEFVRLNKNLSVNIHIAEDLFEAFTGALFRTANNIKNGLGFILCGNLVKLTFDPVEFSAAFLYDPSKTFINQSFNSLGWGSSPKLEIIQNADGTFTSNIYFTEAAFKYLTASGFHPPAKLGSGTANNKGTAESIAYSNALTTLISIGVTNEWVSAQKFDKEFNDVLHPELTPILQPLKMKMRSDKIIQLYFEITDTRLTDGVQLLELYGVRSGYQRPVSLGSVLIPHQRGMKWTEKHVDLLREYINKM